jgi:hypothetical protein
MQSQGMCGDNLDQQTFVSKLPKKKKEAVFDDAEAVGGCVSCFFRSAPGITTCTSFLE